MIVPDGLFNGDVERPVQQREKGDFTVYDLRNAKEGGLLAIRSHSDVHILVKEAAGEHDDARQNWRLLAEREIGTAVKLVLLEPNRFGSSFLTHGIILKQGMELGVVKQDEEPRTMKSLGVIAGIAYATTEVEGEQALPGMQPA